MSAAREPFARATCSSVEYVDTHAHLDDPAFDLDRERVIAAAVAAGVTRIVNIGYRPARWTSTIALAHRHPQVAVAIGLHPHHADEFDAGTVDRIRDTIASARAVALGEIGLDYFRDGPPPAVQRAAFETQLDLAVRLDIPIVIHQRAAEPDLIAVLAGFPKLPRLVLHSFDGSQRLADLGIERGWIFGVGGLATRASADALRTVLATVPLARLVLETDAPYLVPAGIKERRNVSANLAYLASRLAPLWGVTGDALATATSATAASLFGLGAAQTQAIAAGTAP